ncbi:MULTISPECIES: hypothetical protein [Bacillaceae]|uniref:Uncharacterized protein n=1 Tax=Evansella alkalicola TaxID=745819 RepID=A0ABS6JXN9_9BACI|nr:MULTISPECIES: hypothetical protein [Bacillaceae]MBU9723351.1 hypothetical protein [Bacillus alkalicola]
MAKSKAKKKRDHVVRNGGRNATKSRGMAVSFSTHERRTKSKKDTIYKLHNKHKKRSLHQNTTDDGTIFYGEITYLMINRFFMRKGIFPKTNLISA